MTQTAPILSDDQTPEGSRSLLQLYRAVPLYLRILVGLILGVVLGLVLGERAGYVKFVSQIVLRFLGALAPALILVAVIDSIVNANIKGRGAARLVYLLVLNTIVAILIGLLVANVVRPGKHGNFAPATRPADHLPKGTDLGEQLIENIPRSVLEPLVSNNVIGVVFLAIAFGIALRRLAGDHDIAIVNQVIQLAFKAIVIVLHWIIDLVPLAVLCTVASEVGTSGLGIFVKLGWFIVAVIVALLLQATWYLVRIRLGSWVRPRHLLRGMRDALTMAFSTSSSTATMPVTYACLRERVGLREDSASMGALVGSNFNNDGTALYEAMAALFVAQILGVDLTLGQQVVVVLMSIVASVGAAGIPEAGLVTMTLVFRAVHLPPEAVLWLLPVDWFLDRCRTVINVMGDVNVSCLMEGKQKSGSQKREERPQVVEVAS
jgi:DAACS family dicarboxylate/amino acid:cation (Na+ or H+) symporter